MVNLKIKHVRPARNSQTSPRLSSISGNVIRLGEQLQRQLSGAFIKETCLCHPHFHPCDCMCVHTHLSQTLYCKHASTFIFAFFFSNSILNSPNASYHLRHNTPQVCTYAAKNWQTLWQSVCMCVWFRGRAQERGVIVQVAQRETNATCLQEEQNQQGNNTQLCTSWLLTCCSSFFWSGGKCNYLVAAGVINKLYAVGNSSI